jgi:hypothetical protein
MNSVGHDHTARAFATEAQLAKGLHLNPLWILQPSGPSQPSEHEGGDWWTPMLRRYSTSLTGDRLKDWQPINQAATFSAHNIVWVSSCLFFPFSFPGADLHAFEAPSCALLFSSLCSSICPLHIDIDIPYVSCTLSPTFVPASQKIQTDTQCCFFISFMKDFHSHKDRKLPKWKYAQCIIGFSSFIIETIPF